MGFARNPDEMDDDQLLNELAFSRNEYTAEAQEALQQSLLRRGLTEADVRSWREDHISAHTKDTICEECGLEVTLDRNDLVKGHFSCPTCAHNQTVNLSSSELIEFAAEEPTTFLQEKTIDQQAEMIGKTAAVLTMPVVILNVCGVLLAGIWLAVLGEWWAIGYGLIAFLVSPWLLGLLMTPSVGIMGAAIASIERSYRLPFFILAFLSNLYVLALFTGWSFLVISFFLVKEAIHGVTVPLVIWTYGIATGPFSYMASREDESAIGTWNLLLFMSLSFIALMIALAAGVRDRLTLLLVFCGVETFGLVIQMFLAKEMVEE